MSENAFHSVVWLLMGPVTSAQGVLSLENEYLTLHLQNAGSLSRKQVETLGVQLGKHSLNTDVRQEGGCDIFHLAVKEAKFIFPKAGLKTSLIVHIGPAPLRLSIVKPANAMYVPDKNANSDDIPVGFSIPKAREIGSTWENLLTGNR